MNFWQYLKEPGKNRLLYIFLVAPLFGLTHALTTLAAKHHVGLMFNPDVGTWTALVAGILFPVITGLFVFNSEYGEEKQSKRPERPDVLDS